MIRRLEIFTFISSLAISLSSPISSQAQEVIPIQEETSDSVAFFNGFSVSIDLAGIIQRAVSDYGQYEASVRLNLFDHYFPIFEVGVGSAKHDDVVTKISYKSTAPYFRIGLDYNFMKDKHDVYRIYGGARYAFSYFTYDMSHPGLDDPYWGGHVDYGAEGVKCNCHWAELSAGVDAKIWGPLHMGWSVRYRKRLFHNDGSLGNVWYVPGYGQSGSTRLGGTFNITIDI